MSSQEQFLKLPKWAQSEIISKDLKIEDLQNRLNYFLGEKETNTFIRQGFDSKPLPNNSVIEFKTGDRLMNTVSVYVMWNGDININTDSRIGETMSIKPMASNSFHITFKK